MTSKQLKADASQAISKSLQIGAYRGRPTERLAAMIAVTLIGYDRHSPDRLQWTLEQVTELKHRLENAKV